MHKDLVNVTQQHQQQMIATISYKYDTAIQQRGVGQAYPEREPETNNIEKKTKHIRSYMLHTNMLYLDTRLRHFLLKVLVWGTFC